MVLFFATTLLTLPPAIHGKRIARLLWPPGDPLGGLETTDWCNLPITKQVFPTPRVVRTHLSCCGRLVVPLVAWTLAYDR